MANKKRQRILKWTTAFTLSCFTLILSNRVHASANNILGGPTHLGTFEGQTTFTTSSSNGINPGLYLEVMDEYGNYTEYMSEEGVITIDGTKEGAYITQAKLLGKTKYVDQDTGEILDQWEEGRNLKLESVKMPVLTTTGGDLVNLFDANNVEYLPDPEDCLSEYYEAKSGDKFSFVILSGGYVWTSLYTYDSSKTVIHWNYNDHYANEGTFIVPDDKRISFVRFKFGTSEKDVTLLNRGETPYVYDKTNILTCNEDVTLRSNGNICDELNLLTGQLTQRIDEDGEVLSQEVVKTVDLNSTYEFSPVNTRQVLVEGEILPLICSITTPTEPLSFVLNPNLEEDEQFIAPDFTISNNSPASVSIELKNFEQTTDVLNDVSPTKYQNWSTLDKTQSKDIALAINPKPGDGWEHLQEGPRYAADQKGSILGEIKPNSSVDLTFSALHGQAFTKALKPQYRLVFLFDF